MANLLRPMPIFLTKYWSCRDGHDYKQDELNYYFRPRAESNLLLRYACHSGDLDFIKQLLSDNRVDPAIDDNEALYGALCSWQWHVIRYFVRQGIVSPSVDSNSILMEAIYAGNIQTVRCIVNHPNFNPNLRKLEIAHMTIRKGNCKILRFLYESKKYSADYDDNFPIQFAKAYNPHMLNYFEDSKAVCLHNNKKYLTNEAKLHAELYSHRNNIRVHEYYIEVDKYLADVHEEVMQKIIMPHVIDFAYP